MQNFGGGGGGRGGGALTQALAFFDQKHGVTPSEKWDFKDFETFCFCSQKRFHFSLQSQ